jgi:UTP--glucose-1-phosphate uridylyltransferase
MQVVRKAVIPAAGFGTRFLPATKSQPKEMLPIVDKPTIQFVVEEAIASGINDILIITSSDKRSIEDHFDKSAELERQLEAGGKAQELADMRRLSDLANIHYIRQKEPRGLGDALRYAHQHVEDEPFALLLGDTIVRSAEPCTKQLIAIFDFQGRSIVGLEKVPRDKVERYGIIAGRPINGRLYLIDDLIEKPSAANAPSDLAIGGRYILTPRVFECIEKTKPGKNGEIQLTDAIRLMKGIEPVYGYHFDGVRHDIGNRLDYVKTFIEFALDRDEIGPAVREHLKTLLK